MRPSIVFRGFIILAVAGFLTGCSEPAGEKEALPNVVFLFADDLTYTAINALGNKEILTPHLNRLVRDGTVFTHAYNMGGWNGAICVASRAMIISGRSIWDANGFRQNWLRGKGLDKTWGKLMERRGYDTYMSGKWHVDAGADDVFLNVAHERPGMPPDALHRSVTTKRPEGYYRPINEQDTSWSPTDKKFGGYWEGGTHWSEVLKDDALGFIDRAKLKNKPFFMYLAFNAPHDPRQSPREYLDKYPLSGISMPESWLPEYPFKDSIGNGMHLRDEALAPFPRTPFAIKTHLQEYYAIITHLDEQVGAILDQLEVQGLTENTYIIFTADHGLSVGRHGLMGKQNLFDHSIRVPFMITGPGIPKGKSIDTDIYLQDAMATSLDLAGIEKPDYLYFNSVLPLVRGTSEKSAYDAIYGGYMDLQRMIRKDGYKLIIYPRLSRVLLFDLKQDPEEMHNLADEPNPMYSEKINELFADLILLQESLHDHLDLKPLYHSLTGN